MYRMTWHQMGLPSLESVDSLSCTLYYYTLYCTPCDHAECLHIQYLFSIVLRLIMRCVTYTNATSQLECTTRHS